jgi:hypothetical protein
MLFTNFLIFLLSNRNVVQGVPSLACCGLSQWHVDQKGVSYELQMDNFIGKVHSTLL